MKRLAGIKKLVGNDECSCQRCRVENFVIELEWVKDIDPQPKSLLETSVLRFITRMQWIAVGGLLFMAMDQLVRGHPGFAVMDLAFVVWNGASALHNEKKMKRLATTIPKVYPKVPNLDANRIVDVAIAQDMAFLEAGNREVEGII